MARRQTGGRGRQGRSWESVEGNLHASTLVRLRGGDLLVRFQEGGMSQAQPRRQSSRASIPPEAR